MKILLLTPPMTQLNTPYPATAYLKGFLRTRGVDSVQADAALELVIRLFSRTGLNRIREKLLKSKKLGSRSAAFLQHFDYYDSTVEPVIRFLQGKDPSLALRIASREFLPEGPRFEAVDVWQQQGDGALNWAFGSLGIQDRAKYYATLYLDDLADVIAEGIDPRFSFSRYAEKLAASQASFEPLLAELESAQPTLLDVILDKIVADYAREYQPDVVVITAPFPGNVYGAFRIARALKNISPSIKTIFGGGYVNTELRSLEEPRVFDYFDFVTLDDGERPLECILEHVQGKRSVERLLRTFIRKDRQVVLISDPREHDIPHRDTGAPDYRGLKLDQYLSVLEMLNPMHRIWSDGRWNKLTLAHGCYWKKCSFCDISLDYIGRYDAVAADLLVDRIEQVMKETGQTGFHFVDEAAPPAVLRALAERLIARKVTITWWGNIRFEKTFTPELTKLLARSGCVAVSGGLEVASDRLLKKMNKGVSVEQVTQVTKAFSDAGVLVHAYLMYGFPSQTRRETIEALERVRVLFEKGCIQSAYWHRFSATIHSPVGKNPSDYGIRIVSKKKLKTPLFARNDLDFEDLETDCDPSALAPGLNKALYNYMLGVGLDKTAKSWFSKH